MRVSIIQSFVTFRSGITLLFLLLLLGLLRPDRPIRLNLAYVALAQATIAPSPVNLASLAGRFPPCQDASCARTAYGLGLLADLAGDDAGAVNYWEQAAQLAPADPLANFRLAAYWQEAGDEARSLAYGRRAGLHTYWTAQGDWQRQQGQMEGAVSAYRLALQLDPAWDPARQGLALALREEFESLWDAGQFNLAIPMLQEIASLAPRPWDYVRLGDFERNQDDLAGAIAWYEQGMARFPDFGQYPLRLGQLAQQDGRQEQAIAYFQQAVQLEPENAQAHFLLGVAYLQAEQFDQAEASLLTRIRLAPDQWAYARLGDVYAAQDRLAEAETAYRQALAIAPDMAYAQRQLDRLRSRKEFLP